jgi:hypothetical protein
MPRDLLVLSTTAPSLVDFVDAGASVDPELRVRSLDGDAVVEVVDDHGTAHVSVQHPERVDNQEEVRRLAPWTTLRAPLWWTEAWAPWGAHGEVGVAIARALAAEVDGELLVEDGS